MSHNLVDSLRSISSKHRNEKAKAFMSDNPEFKKDDERSTWWSEHKYQNKKFIRWIQNELIRDSIYDLV